MPFTTINEVLSINMLKFNLLISYNVIDSIYSAKNVFLFH